MTSEEMKRFEQLENIAIQNCLDKNDFCATDWLDEAQAKEYAELAV